MKEIPYSQGVARRSGTKFIAELPRKFGKPAEIIALANAGIIVVRKDGSGIYIRKDGRSIRVPDCVVKIAKILQLRERNQRPLAFNGNASEVVRPQALEAGKV